MAKILHPNPDKPEIPMTKSQFPNNNQTSMSDLSTIEEKTPAFLFEILVIGH
ncbi:hypothetical protein LM597_03800 [Candidatus Acetothermia bacterium]|nr:hypothetical protein [Candidatus Acetothermia bacterium]